MQITWMSPTLITIFAAFCAMCACAAILHVLLVTGWAWRLATDVPNDRSLHDCPVPRIGGWGLVPVCIVAIAWGAPSLWLIAAGGLGLAVLSQLDDRRGLSVRVRLTAHLLVASAVIWVYPAHASWWICIGLIFLLLWLINLYNFMDGVDGLAGGMALFGFGGYTIAALIAPAPAFELALACAAVAGGAAGFLWFNFHPARLFLGDAGSVPLGFFAGAFGYWGWHANVWPAWFPMLVFAPFIVDSSATLARRLCRGDKVWQAHCEHYYQRMVRSGIGHARTADYWYVVMLAGIIAALCALGRPLLQQWLMVAAWYLVLTLIGIAIDVYWRRFATVASK